MNLDGYVPEAKKRNSPWLTRVQILLGLGVMVYILRMSSLGDIFGVLKQSANNWPWLVIGIILPGCGLLIAALRWKILLGAHSFKIKMADLLEALLIAAYFNQFFPSTVGGDVARSWWVVKKGNFDSNLQMELSLTIVLLDRVLGIAGILSVGVLAIFLSPNLMDQLGGIFVLLVIIVLVVFITLSLLNLTIGVCNSRFVSTPICKFINGVVSAMFEALRVIRNHKMVALWAFCLSISFQILIIIQYIILTKLLGLNLPMWEFGTIIPIVSLFTLMPITINGIGLREGTLAILGGGLGLAIGEAVALGLIFMVIGLVYGFIGCIIFLRKISKSQKLEMGVSSNVEFRWNERILGHPSYRG